MKKVLFVSIILTGLFISSCTKTETEPDNQLVAPDSYSFVRAGSSTVSFSGQTTRIDMATAFSSALIDPNNSLDQLNSMFAHEVGNADFTDEGLNSSSKNIRSKIAASTDYYSANTTEANAIKAEFDSWINTQAGEVFPNWDKTAVAGTAGQIQQAGGGTSRYVTDKGLEMNQVIAKAVIGALMTDQILNNYLSPAVLDAGETRTNNDSGVLEEGHNYTTMEHKWDEALGYLYGKESDITAPELGQDKFLNEYLDRVEGDSDFTGIASDVYNAFKLGRAAIVAKNYTVRDEQAQIIKEKISLIPAVRAVYYLQSGKTVLSTDKATAFHALSEGFGFIYSLQFGRKPNSNTPYFTRAEVTDLLNQLNEGNGLWDLTPEKIDNMSATIASRFGFTVEQAAN